MYSKYLSQIEEIEDEKEAAKVQIQAIAREHAGVLGSTIRFVDNQYISVTVQSPRAAPSYSLKKARRFWDKELVRKVLTIDDKLVRELIESGDISEEVAAAAAVHTTVMTPRVTVTLKGRRNEEA
jgi:hypothetical protein